MQQRDRTSVMKQWKSLEKFIFLGIALAMVILIIISSISYQNLVHIKRDFDWVRHSRSVFFDLSQYLSNLQDAESEQHTHGLTGDEAPVRPYEYLTRRVKYDFEYLRKVAPNGSEQTERLDILEQHVADKLAEFRDVAGFQEDAELKKTRTVADAEARKNIIKDIQTLFLSMDKEERMLLDQRSRKIDLRIRLDAVVKGTGITLILVTSILIMFRVNRWLRDRAEVERTQMEVVNMTADLMSTVSHELRTPLKAIEESISIALDTSGGLPRDKQTHFLAVAKRNIDRLKKLTDSTLDMNKLDANKMEFNLDEHDINEVVSEVYELMEPLASKHGISLRTQLDSSFPKLPFDKDRILQVLINVVDNAIRFTKNGRITIVTRLQETVAVLSVEDTGCGVAKEDLHKLFNRFEQVAAPGTSPSCGTGLGLAISKEIVERHKGIIWAESEIGKGTTVHFTLPVVVCHA